MFFEKCTHTQKPVQNLNRGNGKTGPPQRVLWLNIRGGATPRGKINKGPNNLLQNDHKKGKKKEGGKGGAGLLFQRCPGGGVEYQKGAGERNFVSWLHISLAPGTPMAQYCFRGFPGPQL